MHRRWEYKSVVVHNDAEFNQLGADGWELVSVSPRRIEKGNGTRPNDYYNVICVAFFKRPTT